VGFPGVEEGLMAVNELLEYDSLLKIMDRSLEIYGQPASIWVPKRQDMLGYEDLGKWAETLTGVHDIANLYSMYQGKVWIEFNIKRGVFYHFNLNPEDDDNKQLVQAFLPTNSIVREGSFIRTAASGGVSIWGDFIFSVVKVVDEGQFKTLKRTYFMRPVVSEELHRFLDPVQYQLAPNP
jgi:hypothetical protein